MIIQRYHDFDFFLLAFIMSLLAVNLTTDIAIDNNQLISIFYSKSF